jgi:putative transposon-encoded protein
MLIIRSKDLLIFKYLKISMRVIELKKGNLKFTDEIEGFIEKKVTRFGTSAKVDCPRKYIGRKAYLLICKE